GFQGIQAIEIDHAFAQSTRRGLPWCQGPAPAYKGGHAACPRLRDQPTHYRTAHQSVGAGHQNGRSARLLRRFAARREALSD
ncbi:hypothetical protein Q6289_29100, partial [Klebsiella pneumoniae]